MRNSAAPINVRWGYDNRTVGLRVPLSQAEARRVEKDALDGLRADQVLASEAFGLVTS